MSHSFGGGWTETKLACLEEYLHRYMTVFSANERARYLNPIYVDAFAGSGTRRLDVPLLDILDDPEWDPFRKGSASVALGLAKPFREYLFIEQNGDRIVSLEALRARCQPARSKVEIIHGDANSVLPTWMDSRNWRRDRAVVFLDPYGMNVDWTLVEKIAHTKAIDLWYLIPLGMGIERLLTRNQMPPRDFADRLDRMLGTPDWRNQFYLHQVQPTLFGDDNTKHTKQAGFRAIGKFVVERLKTIFAGVVEEPLLLYNTRDRPLYLFCFAAGNERGAPTAIRIAQGVIDRLDRDSRSGHKLRETEDTYL